MILVIEDFPDVRLVVADMLTGSGYEVIAVGDAQTGLQKASAYRSIWSCLM